MKHATAATTPLLVLALLVSGCSSATRKNVEPAADVLGPAAVYVLSDPTRVEGWNFQRPDGSIAADPAIQRLKTSTGKALAQVLLDPVTYKEYARGGAFEKAVGFRVWRGDQAVEIYLSFNTDQLYLKHPGYAGGVTSSSAGFTHAREEVLTVVHEAFPGYKAPDAPKHKKVK
jgi:hypothetical protein